MPKITDFVGGILPAIASGAAGKENRGFALGILPGMLYKDKYEDDQQNEIERQKERALIGLKKGGQVKKMADGGSASKRADGIAQRGKTRGKMV